MFWSRKAARANSWCPHGWVGVVPWGEALRVAPGKEAEWGSLSASVNKSKTRTLACGEGQRAAAVRGATSRTYILTPASLCSATPAPTNFFLDSCITYMVILSVITGSQPRFAHRVRHRDENPVTVSPIECAFTKRGTCKSFRIRFYENCRVPGGAFPKLGERRPGRNRGRHVPGDYRPRERAHGAACGLRADDGVTPPWSGNLRWERLPRRGAGYFQPTTARG